MERQGRIGPARPASSVGTAVLLGVPTHEAQVVPRKVRWGPGPRPLR